MEQNTAQNAALEAYWQRFLQATGRDPALRYLEAFHFETTEKWANLLLELVLQGKKRATASSLYYFRNNGLPLPQPGDCCIVTDFAGEPRCVIQTTAVITLPFREVSWEMAAREGEDENLASWQEGHVRFFTADGQVEGYTFGWDMPVVFEDFEVVWPKVE